MEETKIIYHIDDEDTPYLIKLPISAERVTLGDFKNALPANRPNYKFFFKSMDHDFGVVKEELVDDEATLPCFNGRVVSWLVTADSSQSDTQSQSADTNRPGGTDAVKERVGGIGNSRPPSFHAVSSTAEPESSVCDTYTESQVSNRRVGGTHGAHGTRNRPRNRMQTFDASSSVLGSDIESVSVIDSEDTCSRFSSVTDTTQQSSVYGRNRRKKLRHRMPPISQASSMSSITDSTMSLNVVTVTLNMDTVNFLGISIVGQTNKGGDGGIYVGSIMKGAAVDNYNGIYVQPSSYVTKTAIPTVDVNIEAFLAGDGPNIELARMKGAVAQDGRIEPGDMILEVNGVSFEDMTNDEAVRTLRAAAQRPGPVTLVVAKCWDPTPKNYLAPRQEPVRPIDPSAWVAHTEAVRAMYGRLGPPPSVAGVGNAGPPSVMASIPESALDSQSSYPSVSLGPSMNSTKNFDRSTLSIHSDVMAIVRAMSLPDSGLEIRDRMWLKITIPNAFIGSDLVNWLQTHVEGFADRRDARRYACELLKNGYIRHTVNKMSFSEQCYYTIAEICSDMCSMTLDDMDIMSDMDSRSESVIYDTLGPPTLPAPATAPWMTQYAAPGKPYTPSYMTPGIAPLSYLSPAPYNFVNDAMSLDSLLIANGADTVKSSSESTESGQSQVRPKVMIGNNAKSSGNPVAVTTLPCSTGLIPEHNAGTIQDISVLPPLTAIGELDRTES